MMVDGLDLTVRGFYRDCNFKSLCRHEPCVRQGRSRAARNVDRQVPPARILSLVIPGVDVFPGADSVADKLGVAIVTEFFVSDNPSRPGIHVSLQLYNLLGQPLGESVERVAGALIAALCAGVWFDRVEGSLRIVDSVVVVAEDLARRFKRG